MATAIPPMLVALLAAFWLEGAALSAAEATWDGSVVAYGSMHEAIGQQQHQGRVELGKLTQRPHFFAVAALERLEGEATIVDGTVTVTQVADNSLAAVDPSAASLKQATLLIGAYVPKWIDIAVDDDVSADDVDRYIAAAATKAGIDVTKPFPFAIDGEFDRVRLHVINGACPLHARLRKKELPDATRPFEAELDRVGGTVVGVFAKDAVGRITHPATSTHMHLVYDDSDTGKKVTGHVEQIGLRKGSVLRLPQRGRSGE